MPDSFPEPRGQGLAGRPLSNTAAMRALHAVPEASNDRIRDVLFRSWPGLLLWAAIGLRAGFWWIGGNGTVGVLGALTSLVALASSVVVGVRVSRIARRRFLWSVRRRMMLSYFFVGAAPVVLGAAFAALLIWFLAIHVSAFLYRRGFDELVEQSRMIGETAAAEISRVGVDQWDDILRRKVENASPLLPGLSAAIVPREADRSTRLQVIKAGDWAHDVVPNPLPGWVARLSEFGGLLGYSRATSDALVVARTVTYPNLPGRPIAVVVDVPISARVISELADRTGITLNGLTIIAPGNDRTITVQPSMQRVPGDLVLSTMSLFDCVQWTSGQPAMVMLGLDVRLAAMYRRMSTSQSRVTGNSTLSDVFLMVLGTLGVLFVIIELSALVMGLSLARSITTAVDSLVDGTKRVQRGDFTHTISVASRDQLGELAQSFNQMTRSIDVLLLEAEGKQRLEEELRIAREIQMSLLPRGPVDMPGLDLATLCAPAREVGGDYFDFFRLDEHRLALLVADVAGKGTSAALYMAELKGLLSSLARTAHSPKSLLCQVNRILAETLDSRSFITMSYAIVDMQARTCTWARAGHTPLVQFTGNGATRGRVQMHTPAGLVLGFKLESVAARFEQILEEHTIALHDGDVFIFYTDGVTEAMNATSDLFGEERLVEVLSQSGAQCAATISQRIQEEVAAFVDGADPHDDMTMVVVRVGRTPAVAGA